MSTNQNLASLARAILTTLGTFLIGRSFFGHPLFDTTWEAISGVAVTLSSVIWSIVHYNVAEDQLDSLLRQLYQGAAALFVSSGLMSTSQAAAVGGCLLVAMPYLQSLIAKWRNKKLVTGQTKINPVTAKSESAPPKYMLVLLLAGIGMTAHGQSPFRPMPKVVTVQSAPAFRHSAAAVILADSFVNAWRFTANFSPGAYTINGTYQVLAGAEYGYQHQKWDYTTNKWKVVWSINGAWFPLNSAAFTDSLSQGNIKLTLKSLSTIGATFGFNNNLFQLGPMYNPNAPPGKRWGLLFSFGITLNN